MRRVWLWGVVLGVSSWGMAYTGPATSLDFASVVHDFSSLGGQSAYADPSKVLGWPGPLASPAVPDNSKVFSFGWGGWVTVGFSRALLNLVPSPSNPSGADFIVFGNAFYPGGNILTAWIEPGQVEVGVDANGSGVPDAGDLWYRTRRRHPEGALPLPNSWFGNVAVGAQPVVGWADVTPVQNQGDPLVPDDPRSPGISAGSAGGDAFDLDWLQDAQGRPVSLKRAHFVRIRHAGQASLGFFGQSSTEVSAVSILRSPSLTSAQP